MTNATIRYPSQVYGQTHPAAIGALAALLGRKVPPFGASRVLEIGCGEGVNLMAMAIAAPGAEFVGVDIDGPAIANARATAAQCGAGNAAFHALDLSDIGGAFGDFDFIIAHGVYAWTPDAVRTALMRAIGERLTPHGLAFVSFNALPGARLRQAVRDMLVTVTDGADDPAERLEIARAFLAEQIESWSDTDADESALKSVAKGILRKAPEVLFHDELAPGYAPEMLSQVIARARPFGLAYLCDAEPNVSAEAFFPTEPFASLRARSGGDWGRFEQLADFRNLRPFRNAIFARGGAPDPRREAARLRGLWASADLRIENADPNAPEGALFVSSGGAKLRTNNPALAGLLTRLSETFPLALPLDAALELDALADHLYQLFVTHVVRLATVPQPFVDRPGDRPKANALARVQAGRGEMQLATLRHAMIRIDEPRMLAFVPLIDGSRTRVELVQEFARLFAIAQNEAEWRLDESLAELGRRGLMVE
ncbi:methyltransferase domain-containing protein [Roseiarcus sp.]|uniref:methyltransferase domain-containing protein n=1 Tax=Roseiarcus sp. TaxID=1969460 RepID=UPI003F9860E3